MKRIELIKIIKETLNESNRPKTGKEAMNLLSSITTRLMDISDDSIRIEFYLGDLAKSGENYNLANEIFQVIKKLTTKTEKISRQYASIVKDFDSKLYKL